MQKEEFKSLVKDPQKLLHADYMQFNSIISKYPLFSAARILQMIACGVNNPDAFGQLLKANSIYLPDAKHLYKLLLGKKITEFVIDEELSPLLQKESLAAQAVADQSGSALSSDKSKDEDLLMFDYKKSRTLKSDQVEAPEESRSSTTMEHEEQSALHDNRKNELIARFIETNPASIRADNKGPDIIDISDQSIREDESIITDTLAKIYVKQGLYSKAIYTYEKLVLKYPEKSAYFAAQIQEIKKLINK